jgi:hypothetical protein
MIWARLLELMAAHTKPLQRSNRAQHAVHSMRKARLQQGLHAPQFGVCCVIITLRLCGVQPVLHAAAAQGSWHAVPVGVHHPWEHPPWDWEQHPPEEPTHHLCPLFAQCNDVTRSLPPRLIPADVGHPNRKPSIQPGRHCEGARLTCTELGRPTHPPKNTLLACQAAVVSSNTVSGAQAASDQQQAPTPNWCTPCQGTQQSIGTRESMPSASLAALGTAPSVHQPAEAGPPSPFRMRCSGPAQGTLLRAPTLHRTPWKRRGGSLMSC